jgi:hypothetical protein
MALPCAAARRSTCMHEGANEMAKKLDLRLVLVLIWMALHRFVLNWYTHYLGLP